MSKPVYQEWRRNHRRRLRGLLARFKTRKGCADCGYNKHPAALDFDHRDPKTKAIAIANLVACSPSMDRLRKELSKCDVVCANCHRIRTHVARLDNHP